MYLIALIVFLFGIFYGVCVGQDSFSSALYPLYDLPSLFLILLITIPMFLSSGLSGDLKRAFKVISSKKAAYTKFELLKSLEAVKLIIKLLLSSGGFGIFIGILGILRNLKDVNVIGPNMAVAMLSPFYALFACFIFMPIQSKLKVLILSATEEK